MAELTMRALPPKLVEEIREWARLRRTTPAQAAVELLRIGLYVTADRNRSALPPLLLDTTGEGPPRA